MPGTSAASDLDEPTSEDLVAAERAWKRGISRYEAPKGDPWWRILRAPSPQRAEEYAKTCYASPAGSRFTPIMRGAAAVPAAYAGSSQALYSRLPDIDGIVYESHQVPGQCVVLYQPSDPVVFDVAGGATAVSDEPVRSSLVHEALKVDGSVDFGDDP